MSPISAIQISLCFCTVLVLLLLSCPSVSAWTCENSCGGVTLNFPFGSTWSCGSPAFQPYVNCSNGKLLFYTPTGTYTVQSIDYSSSTMIVEDPSMSTCDSMQMSQSFGLPVTAPFSFASYDTVVLLGCSSTSSLYITKSCDSSTSQICQSLYSCPGISRLGLNANSPTYSCCVVSKSLLETAPYEIDLPLLQCSSYSSIYYIGSAQDPQHTWQFGIALQYNASAGSPPSSGNANACYVCQQAEDSGASVGRRRVKAFWVGGLGLILGTFLVFT